LAHPNDKPLSYPVPWDQVFSLWRHVAEGTRRNVDDFSGNIVRKMVPGPAFEGLEHLPADPRFLLVANHYQRPGLWIVHVASALTQAIANRYGRQIDPPVHWVVTANWPPWKIGPLTIPSPGDILLPRVAHALSCFPVSFAGANRAYTAATLKRILKATQTLQRPIGLFPEGVAGSAGQLHPPLPGVDRFIALLAKRNWPAIPAGVSENGRFQIRFGQPIPPASLLAEPNPATHLMAKIQSLL
jgi:1-acyl-sn-glycerol-3-phosphate acyltransferase